MKNGLYCLLTLVALVGSAGTVLGQTPPQFRAVEDDPDLPRVLLLGDSISIGYTLPVRRELEGEVNVHRAPTNCGPTSKGIRQLEEWLGDGDWDVIHFNWGLHDLKYINEEGGRVAPHQGQQQIPLFQYRRNIGWLVKRLKRTGAELIFATTTPVPRGAHGRIAGDAVRYNKAARQVMDTHDIAINNLYEFALDRMDEIQRPANVHFTSEGSDALGKQVAEHIRTALARSNKEDD